MALITAHLNAGVILVVTVHAGFFFKSPPYTELGRMWTAGTLICVHDVKSMLSLTLLMFSWWHCLTVCVCVCVSLAGEVCAGWLWRWHQLHEDYAGSQLLATARLFVFSNQWGSVPARQQFCHTHTWYVCIETITMLECELPENYSATLMPGNWYAFVETVYMWECELLVKWSGTLITGTHLLKLGTCGNVSFCYLQCHTHAWYTFMETVYM